MKIKLIDMLQKYVAPSILGFITIDNYRRQNSSHQKDISNIKQITSEEMKKM